MTVPSFFEGGAVFLVFGVLASNRGPQRGSRAGVVGRAVRAHPARSVLRRRRYIQQPRV